MIRQMQKYQREAGASDGDVELNGMAKMVVHGQRPRDGSVARAVKAMLVGNAGIIRETYVNRLASAVRYAYASSSAHIP